MKVGDFKPDFVHGINYKCDECGRTFADGEVLMVEEPKNLQFGDAKILKHDNKNYLLTCPHCNKIHFFGFDRED